MNHNLFGCLRRIVYHTRRPNVNWVSCVFTLLAIAEALDGPVSILTCLSRPKTCGRHDSCPARSIWGDLNLTIRGALGAITLSSVMRRLGLRHDDADYCI